MWVYWLSLVFLSIVLFFPYKKIFSRPVAIRASAATFVIGLIHPLLQAKLSVGQTFFSLALLLLFLGVTISRHHPNWQEEEQAEREQSNLSPEPTDTELATVKVENTPADAGAGSALLQDDMDRPEVMKPGAEEPGTTEVDDLEENLHAADLDTPALSEDVPESLEVTNPVSQQPDITEETIWEDNRTTAATIKEQALWEDAPEIVGASDTDLGDTTADVAQADSLPVETIPEAALVPADDGSPQSLLVEGLRLAKLKQYAPAVRHFNKVIATDPEPELLYVAISELSSLYQHLGLYPMAAAIINAFAKHPVLKEHPGMDNLIQKAKFIQCLIDLLNRDRYGHIPYEQVPDAVRREAFHNSLTIKHFIS